MILPLLLPNLARGCARCGGTLSFGDQIEPVEEWDAVNRRFIEAVAHRHYDDCKRELAL